MIRTRFPMRRRAAWAAVAAILVVMACGGDPAATPVPPDPPSLTTVAPAPESESPTPVTVAPTTQPESPSPEPPPPPAEPEEPVEPPDEPPEEPPEFDIHADAAWGDVFDSFSASEQSCIRSALGDDLLDSVLEERLMADSGTEEWEVSIFACLTPDNARSLFLAGMIAGLSEEMGEEVGIGELSGEEMSCLRDLVADLDVAALVAADYAGEDNFEFAEATALLIGCLPDLFLAALLADMGVDLAELSEDESSCLREWMSETDWAALTAVSDDVAALEEFEARLFDLFGCIPDAFGLPDPPAAGPDDHGDSLEEATAVTVGEPVDGGMDSVGDLDYFTFEALEGESYQVEVTLGSLEDSVMALYDAEGRELAFNDDRDEESLGSLISWVALESGSHYVEVTSFDPFVTGSYTLSVTAG